jgi:hypothetical protein
MWCLGSTSANVSEPVSGGAVATSVDDNGPVSSVALCTWGVVGGGG